MAEREVTKAKSDLTTKGMTGIRRAVQTAIISDSASLSESIFKFHKKELTRLNISIRSESAIKNDILWLLKAAVKDSRNLVDIIADWHEDELAVFNKD